MGPHRMRWQMREESPGGQRHKPRRCRVACMGGAATGGRRPPAQLGYLRSTLVKMSVSPIPVRSMALLRPSVHTG
jgi:hypothetical protein